MATNTTQQPTIIHALGVLADPRYIENQEAQGQREVAVSGRKDSPTRAQLPTPIAERVREYEALGFKFMSTVEGDPLFTWVMLPAGWSIKPTDHSMHNNIVDAAGNVRGSFFYKAAFYDRDAILYTPLTRYHVTQVYPERARDQTKAQWYDETGLVEYRVRDRLSGKDLHSVTAAVSVTNPEIDPDQHRAWWNEHTRITEEVGAACIAWLAEHFPDHDNAAAYWPE